MWINVCVCVDTVTVIQSKRVHQSNLEERSSIVFVPLQSPPLLPLPSMSKHLETDETEREEE